MGAYSHFKIKSTALSIQALAPNDEGEELAMMSEQTQPPAPGQSLGFPAVQPDYDDSPANVDADGDDEVMLRL